MSLDYGYIWHSKDGSSSFYELWHLNITNSIIWISPTVPSKFHELYHLISTNSGYVPRTLLSKLHELYHLNIMAQEGIWWVYGRGETSEYCELYYQNITNSKTSRTRYLNSNFYYLNVTNASNPVGVGLCVCLSVYVCVCVYLGARARALAVSDAHIPTYAQRHIIIDGHLN